MIRTGATIVREFGPLEYVKYARQTVVNIVTDAENFAFGLWHGLFVAAFNVNGLEWHVCSVPTDVHQDLLDMIAEDSQGG